jgi:hypothetical protein
MEGYVLTASNLSLLGVALVLAWRRRTHMRAVVWYFAYSLVAAIGQSVVLLVFGLSSSAYYYSFHIPNLVVPALQLVVLAEGFYRLFGPTKLSWRLRPVPVMVTLVMVAVTVWGMADLRQSWFARYHAVAVIVQTLACLALYHRIAAQREIDVGRNWKGVLTGMGLMVGFNGLNFAQFLFRDEPFAYFSFFVQFVYFLALVVMIRGLWSEDAVRAISPEDQRRMARVDSQLRALLRYWFAER